MPRKLRDQLDIGAGTVEDDAIDMPHIRFDKRDQRLKARFRIAGTGKLDDDTQGILRKTLFYRRLT